MTRVASLWCLLVLTAGLAVAQPAVVDPTRVVGRPTFEEGDSFGYYVWREGDTWKLRWTTFGAEHRFSGSIRAEGGELEDLKRIDVDEERRIVRPGRAPRVAVGPRGRVFTRGGRAPVVAERTEDHMVREDARTIVFLTLTNDDIDGLEFKTEGPVERIRFQLEVDGVGRAATVAVGRENFHPETNPFFVRVR
jgi:hypothetical protein